MTNSQNGWGADRDRTKIGIVNPKVPGTNVDFPNGVKGGDVEAVLMYVASEFNRKVEKLVDGTCWGYFYKVIEGSSVISNHASGTAIDLNADHHPMGSYNTFKSTQVTSIRSILNFCEGVVRWGGDYSGRKDEMHFEINGDVHAVARVATKIRGLAAPAPKPAHVVKKGDQGDEVRWIQNYLRSVFPSYRDTVTFMRGHLIEVDGIFGDQTVAWVKEFQRRTSLTQDAEVGPVTFAKMRSFGYAH